MKIKVTGCEDCPFQSHEYDDWAVGDNNFHICNLAHYLTLENDFITSYGDLEEPDKIKTPDWCPLEKITITKQK